MITISNQLSNLSSSVLMTMTTSSLIIRFCLFYLLISLSLCDEQSVKMLHKISPVALCDPYKSVNVYERLDECVHRCSNAIDYAGRAQLTLIHDFSKIKGPLIATCSKVQISQTFTETWTFSHIKSSPLRKNLPVGESECTEYIKKHCPDYDCDVAAPSELKEQYAYASDIDRKEEYIELRSHYGTILEIKGILKVSLGVSGEEFNASTGKGSDKNRWHFWDSNMSPGNCPLSDGLVMGCDIISNNNLQYYMCGGSRLAIQKTDSSQLTGSCKDIWRSPSGVLYKVNEASDSSSYKGQKIGMANYKKVDENMDSIRILSQHAIYHVDADLCALQCEVAGIEIKGARRAYTLIRSGAEYILVSPKGHGFQCNPVVQCRLQKPLKMCGSPPRFSVVCNGLSRYWNPALNYILDSDNCPAPSTEEKLRIHIGNKLYDVDDQMYLNLSSDDPYVHKSRSIHLSHDALFEDQDMSEIRSSWMAHKSKNRTSIALNSKDIVNQKSIGLSGISTWVSSSLSNITKMIKHTELAFLLTVIAIVVGYVMYKILTSPRYGYKRTRTNGNDNELNQVSRAQWF
ncbi:glycoprotein [Wuhan Insect virus 4]|uniref:Glycoprotein n=1 Tax=Wuhan Insect virus 4 TaxID=1608109 RepID=A0A0B5KXM6_9RHAB|nr:glycoprotein [Wuhan Insect virus 4]AJG39178.1 glycoprotein [Wuhan Insect virus 4]